MNTIDIMGNLTREPVVRHTKTGKAVASFTVATNRYWTDQNGEKKQLTDYINVVAWSPWADHIPQYLHKGTAVFVQGRQSTRSYEDQNKQKKWITEVIASFVALPIPTGGNQGGGNPNGMNNRGQYGGNATYQQNPQGNNAPQGNRQQGYSGQQGYGNSPDWNQFGPDAPQQGTLGGDDYPW